MQLLETAAAQRLRNKINPVLCEWDIMHSASKVLSGEEREGYAVCVYRVNERDVPQLIIDEAGTDLDELVEVVLCKYDRKTTWVHESWEVGN